MGYLTAKKEYLSFSNSLESFDDQKFATGNPMGVEVRHGEVVDAVRFIYQDTDNPFHGGNGGSLGRLGFAENEYLTRIDLKHGSWYGDYRAVLEITFTTNLKNTRTYGNTKGHSGTTVSFYFDGKPITAFVGKTVDIKERQNKYMADLGVYYIDKFCK